MEHLHERLVTRVKAGVELPTSPAVALQLQRLVAGGGYDLGQLARLVAADQALAAQTLRVANSAFYRAPVPVTTLAQAISRIGAAELSNIAIAATLGARASVAGPLLALRRESWRRSVVHAVLAQALASGRRVDPGQAFLSGLLCDFGETLAYGVMEQLIASGAPALPAEVWQREAATFRVELGMVLAASWQLPEFVSEVVMRHDSGELTGCEHPALVALVAVTGEASRRVLACEAAAELDLGDVAGLTDSERTRLGQLVPTLPGLLQGFEAPGPEPTGGTSAVAPAPSALSQPVWPVDFGVSVSKRERVDAYRARALAHDGLRVVGPQPQPERQLVVLEFEGLRINATVRRCETSEGVSTVELQPFAMEPAAQARWEQLVRAAAGEHVSSS